jgi:hypothetical protein
MDDIWTRLEEAFLYDCDGSLVDLSVEAARGRELEMHVAEQDAEIACWHSAYETAQSRVAELEAEVARLRELLGSQPMRFLSRAEFECLYPTPKRPTDEQ